MIKWLPFLFCFSLFGASSLAQTVINVDLTASPNITKSYEGYDRDGSDCGGNNCIIFYITLNPGSDLVNFTTNKVTSSSWYTVNCGTLTSLNTPACISGQTQVKISFCKSGADPFTYTITASTAVKASDDITVRAGCSAPLSVVGLSEASATWTSIYPGAEGAYNSMLSCTSGCLSTTFTPGSTAPAYIDYKVSGRISNCENMRSDVVRVYVVPGMAVSFNAGNTVICSGSAATLSTNVTGGNPGYTYSWTKDGTSLSQTTPSISVTEIGTYTVTVGDNTNCTPVTQSIVVTAAPTPDAPTANGNAICAGSTATLSATAPGGTYQWFDAAAGGTLVGSGPTFITPPLYSNKTYYVETIVGGCTSPRTTVNVTVNPIPDAPTVAGITICSGNTGTLTATGPGGTYEWYTDPSGGTSLPGTDTFTTPVLSSTTTYYVQTTVNGCTSARTPVVVTVNPTPVAPTALGAAICNNTSVTLEATAPGGNYEWYEAASGGLPIKSSSTYTTPALTATTTYYVQTVDNGCPSARTAVTVMVDAVPDAPTISGVDICSGTATTLTPTAPGGMYRWFNQASGGTPLATAASFNTPTLTASTTYYVQTIVNGCVSSRVPVAVTVNPIPAAPNASGMTICSGNTAVLTATAPGGNYEWYDAASGGTLLGSGDIFTTLALTSTTNYYVQTTINGCTGSRRAVTVTVIPTPVAPTVVHPVICAGTSATLTATAPGGSYRWYNAEVSGALLSPTSSYTTPILTATTVYYVETTVNGCTSARTAVTVTVNPLPAAPAASDKTICSGTAITLTATAPGGVYRWYSAAASGTLLTTNASYTTPILTTTTTYYVEAVSAEGCSGPRTPVTVTVIPEENADFHYSSGTYCRTSSIDPIPTVTNPRGGTFSSTAGLSINFSTGEIDVSTSIIGTYTITFVTNTACVNSSNYDITITGAPDATFTYSGPYCQGQASPALPTFPLGSSAGVFTSTTGLVFLNGLTGEIDLRASTPGTYVVTNEIAAFGGCARATATSSVTINSAPRVTSAASAIICNQATLNYQITSTVSTATYTWSRASDARINSSQAGAGFGQFINETLVNSSTAPLDVIYKIVPTVGSCVGPEFTYTVRVNPTLTNSSPDEATICNKTSPNYQITSDVSSLTYNWSRAGVFGINNSLGASGTEDLIDEQLENTTRDPIDVIYTITPSIGNCNGQDFIYTVKVNPTPIVINDFPAALCNNVTQNHEIKSNVSGTTFTWRRAAVAGIDNQELTGQTNSFITDQLKNTTSFPIDVTYEITPSFGGCNGPEFTYTVSVNPTPTITSDLSAVICNNSTQNYEIRTDVNGTTFRWRRAQVPGIRNEAIVAETGNFIRESLENATTAPIEVVYEITPLINNCEEPMVLYRVTVNPTPDVNAGPPSVCSGTPQNYTISGNVSGTTFTWSRPAVDGISNQLVTNQAGPISEALNNTTNLPVEVKYYINPIVGECGGPPVIYSVLVNPAVKVISDERGTICNNTSPDYPIASNVTGASFTWSRASVEGIRNQPATGQTNTIRESLENITDLPINVIYTIVPSAYGCNGTTFTYTVKVNPTPKISGSRGVTICNNNKHTYQITSNITNSTYTWSRAHVVGISNSEQLAGTGDVIEETLNNTTTAPIHVIYKIVPFANNCRGPEFLYTVTVNPTPRVASAAGASICSGVPHIYSIAGEVANISFTWSRDAVAGIDNPPVSSQIGASISETLINATTTVKDVSYKIVPSANNCDGPEFTYVVKVYPMPVIKSALSAEICNNRNQDYEIISNVTGATFKWSRARVDGIRNDEVSARTDNFIRESLENITTAPIEVVYKITALANNCEGPVAFYRLTVNPTPNVISVPSTSICNSIQHNYTIIGNVANTSFTWSRDAVDGISNLPVSNQPGPNISETLTNTGDMPVEVKYYIYPTANGCNGPMFTYRVTVNPTIRVTSDERGVICNSRNQNYTIISNVTDATFTWSRAFVEGIDNPTATGQTSMIREPLRNTSTVPLEVVYEIIPSIGGCYGAVFSYRVTVNPTPVINSVSAANICNNIAQDYQITSDVNRAGFTWRRAEVEGISNVAVTDQTSDIIAETLVNTTSAPINVVYKIIPSADGCNGPEFTYTVTVNPTLIVNSALGATVCNNTRHSYPISSNLSTATFTWSRAQVAGISNSPATAQTSNITETLVNTSDLPIVVPYHITPSVNGCSGSVFTYNLTVNPTPRVINASLSQVVCSTSSSVAIVPESNVTGTIFAWTATASPGITGFIASGAGTIPAQTLRNVLPGSGTITYTIRPSLNGCVGVAVNYVITVLNQVPVTPLVSNNSPLCAGKSLSLSTQLIAGATYNWTGPNGFTSTSRIPVINNIAVADEGVYTAIITVGQCSASANTTVIVNTPAIVVAGNDQTVCANNAVIQVSGTVAGGSTTGIWTSSGNGIFPSGATALNGTYVPSEADKAAGEVLLTLTATNTASCEAATSSFRLFITPTPVISAGGNRVICAYEPLVLTGQSTTANVRWTSSGSGTFLPGNTSLNASYMPSRNDKINGSVTITLSTAGPSNCIPVTDQINLVIVPAPTAELGDDVYAFENEDKVLNPLEITGNDLQYLWMPNINLNDNTLRNPTFRGSKDTRYTLTVTGTAGCKVVDRFFVKVLKPITIPNAFSPNGDGLNDTWSPQEIDNYPGAVISIFNRYGVKLYGGHAKDIAWDGTYKGSPLPVGIYYYILDLKEFGKSKSGSVMIIR